MDVLPDLHRELVPFVLAGGWTLGEAGGETARTMDDPSALDVPVARVAEVVDAAVAATRDTQQAWTKVPPAEQAGILATVSDLLRERAEAIGALLSREEGNLLAEGVGEANRAADLFDYYAQRTFDSVGELVVGGRGGVEIAAERRPLGTVALITPWSFPIAVPARKLAPALAYGNAAIVKPAEQAPFGKGVTVLALTLVACGGPTGADGGPPPSGGDPNDGPVLSGRVEAWIGGSGSVEVLHATFEIRDGGTLAYGVQQGDSTLFVTPEPGDLRVFYVYAEEAVSIRRSESCPAVPFFFEYDLDLRKGWNTFTATLVLQSDASDYRIEPGDVPTWSVRVEVDVRASVVVGSGQLRPYLAHRVVVLAVDSPELGRADQGVEGVGDVGTVRHVVQGLSEQVRELCPARPRAGCA